MFKRNLFFSYLTTALMVQFALGFLNIPPMNDYETVAFDESIFRAYNASSVSQEEVNVKSPSLKKIKDVGVKATSGSRDVRILHPPKIQVSKKKTALEKLLGVALTGGYTEDARKLVRTKCSNSIIRSYLQLDEEYPSYTHPRIADFEMVDVCENNKTSCCNRQEVLEIKKIFDDKRNKVRKLLKKFRKIVNKLGKRRTNPKRPSRDNT